MLGEKFEKLVRALATFGLTHWLFPYRCRDCGKKMKKMHVTDLAPDAKKNYAANPGASVILEAYGYKCPDSCTGDPSKAYLVA